MTLGTNIFSILIYPGLLELLKKSSDPRVIIVSSGGMLVQKLNVNDLQFEKVITIFFKNISSFTSQKIQCNKSAYKDTYTYTDNFCLINIYKLILILALAV